MKNKKLVLGLLIPFGLYGALAMATDIAFSHNDTLERNLAEYQTDINELKSEIETKTAKLAHKEALFKDTRCLLARLKTGEGESVSEETKEICFMTAQ